MESHRATTTSSDFGVERCNGVYLTSLATPSNNTPAVLNWITGAGYANGDELKDVTKPTLLMTIHRRGPGGKPNGAATIWIGGVEKEATDIPFKAYASAPTVPILEYNYPRETGGYIRTITFTKPNGQSTVIERTQFDVIST